jgi:hypothetical protein
MKDEAQKSPIQFQLCAAILKDKKMVGKPCCNTSNKLVRGMICGSVHAEANAIISYFGKDLRFDNSKKRWCLLWFKSKCEEI